MLPSDQVRRDLEYLLQETDHRRPLDSLECVTVQAYLTGKGFPVAAGGGAAERPLTIEGWVEWVVHCSSTS